MIDLTKRPLWLDALILAVWVTLVFGAGWAVNGWRLGAEIERIKGEHTAQVARNALLASGRLVQARLRNEAIAAELAEDRINRARITQEKNDEIKRLATGRRCLDAAVVSVLNRPDSAGTGPVPAPGPEPVPGTARFATDADVGLWANACADAYKACRADRRGIRKFYEGEPQ